MVEAIDSGWSGPPFDPLLLAELWGIEVVPCSDVPDAQTVPVGHARYRVEFNPNRPTARVRYSLAHELAHTLFSDCSDEVRRRGRHQNQISDAWQLEALCNVAAAEILLPIGAMGALASADVNIERLDQLQRRFEVSVEAAAVRMVRLVSEELAMFCASRVERGTNAGRYRIDYMIGSRAWSRRQIRGALLPADTVLRDCTGVGYTTESKETWDTASGPLDVGAVGVPPYPGTLYPRVVGLVRPHGTHATTQVTGSLAYVRGSALEPRGSGVRFIVQVVNDKTPNWGGGGFAQAVRSQWPDAQEDFRKWVGSGRLELGSVRMYHIDQTIVLASIVAQKGYGESAGPRVRYAALKQGLEEVAPAASKRRAAVHMPRIGAGHAGGNWRVIEDLIRTTCCDMGLSVTVYDLPGSAVPETTEGRQGEFRFR